MVSCVNMAKASGLVRARSRPQPRNLEPTYAAAHSVLETTVYTNTLLQVRSSSDSPEATVALRKEAVYASSASLTCGPPRSVGIQKRLPLKNFIDVHGNCELACRSNNAMMSKVRMGFKRLVICFVPVASGVFVATNRPA